MKKPKLNSAYWQNRYENQETGWDAGTITTPLKEYIDQLKDKSIKILIPGCGNAHELEYLINKGFNNVNVLDYAQEPLQNIAKKLPHFPKKQLIQADFFNHEDSYDLIIEQTFFCALDPSLREDYAAKMKQLLSDKGKIIGLLFQFPLSESGPPFGGSTKEYLNLFEPHFTIHTLETAYNSIQPRKGNELFFIFTKK